MNRRTPTALPGDTLESWKAIAAYLNRDVRTVIRWERSRGLPVHRIPGGVKGGVFALASDLDAWRDGTGLRLVRETQDGTPRSPSIAVLPFTNLSSSLENQYFSDGLADGIITALTRIQGLRVTARTSSFAFRGHETDVREIGKRLGVRTVLEGSVQRVGECVRESAQLADADSGFHLWSEQYDRGVRDVFAIEDEVSHAIASALKVHLKAAPAIRPTQSQEAYQCWLKGRYHYYETLDAVKCHEYLKQAVALDPGFAQAHLGLAAIDRSRAELGVLSPREAFAEGWGSIRRAFELNSSLGEAYALSGAYRAWMDFDWSAASADFHRALELAPASAEAHRLYAIHYLVPTGRLGEAEEQMQEAVESDPVCPLAYIELGKVLLWARQFDRAQAAMAAAFELRPEYWIANWYRGVGMYFQGRIEEAVNILQSVRNKCGPTPMGIGAIGMVLAQLGRRTEAYSKLAELDAAEGHGYVPQISRAQIHVGLGETDAAFHCLDRSIEARDIHILDLPCKPIWDGLRSDPRFTKLLQKMRLA